MQQKSVKEAEKNTMSVQEENTERDSIAGTGAAITIIADV